MKTTANAASVREFGSMILTVDHTTQIADAYVQKAVFSTESQEAAFVANVMYYNEGHLLQSTATIHQLQQLALAELPAMVYRTPENIQIIFAMETFNAVASRYASLCEAFEAILDTVGENVNRLEKAAGDVVPLIVIDWQEADDLSEHAVAVPMESRDLDRHEEMSRNSGKE